MDCNKEEALRARDIAEKKMETKDFAGARKVALKAKQLYPDLESISQMLIVCDVHCAAEHKLNGNEMDWYKILQIELTANDATIKKQYRKFALQLHPDKNKFSGAEAAFKLIGEAQRVLLDSLSRSRFDAMYRRVTMNKNAMPSYNLQKVPTNFSSSMQRNVRPTFTNLNPQKFQQPRQSSQQGVLNGGSATFWTACTFCSYRYEYYREVLNRALRCQNCNKPFIAYDVDMKGTTPATNSTQQAFGQQKYGVNHGASKAGAESQGNFNNFKTNAQPSGKKGPTIDASRKPNRKRKNQGSESTESSDSEVVFADNDSFDGVEKFSSNRDEHRRRSTRQKHQVSYKENVSDDDDDDDNALKPSKRRKGSGSSSDADEICGDAAKMNYQKGSVSDLKDDHKEFKRKHSEESLVNGDDEIKEARGKEAGDNSKTDEASESTSFAFPDPEFNDFDKDKKEECFEAGQIWALFDTADGMPRFYAIIRKVFSHGFKVRLTWLEPDPDEDDEIHWFNEQLPIACGKFKLGATDTTEDHLMFSHLHFFEKINRSTFKVYPRKCETWALFKNWDIKWYMDAKSHQQYDYEFVEILSDYVEGEGVVVAYLAKLKDFVSLFSRIMKEGEHTVQIPSSELFRFSHRVPSFKMSGEERVGVPVGSYELDPASLPQNLEEITIPEHVELKVGPSPSVRMNTKPDGVYFQG
ncbi:putative DnaJ domain-containing protein [Lupinus albus]|uniref:Putative DnaJ domain-containing protein n=1 Tax=Lupinus albus TaxID=3870 RepID=A0A6A4NVA5_LUPAL|nr:putative DnaJ domain-containing protein [Lupinus albus]